MEGSSTTGRSALKSLLAFAALCFFTGATAQTSYPDSSQSSGPTNTASSGRAASWTLDTFVVTGVPNPVRTQNALSPYTVINRQTFAALGAATLADALSQTLNVNTGSDGILGTTTAIGGLSGDKVKVLIDGQPLNGRENGNIDLSQIPLANIERIEIVQGPMSVVYGSDALGGVINLITRKRTKSWSGEAAFLYESTGKYNVDGTVSRKWDKGHSISLQGGRNYFDGWKKIDTTTPQRVYLFKPKEQFFGNLAYGYTAPGGKGMRVAGSADFLREKVTNRGQAHIDPYEGFALDEYYYVNRLITRLNVEKPFRARPDSRWALQGSYALYNRIRERLRKDLVTLDEVKTTAQGDQDTALFNDANLRGIYSGTVAGFQLFGGAEFNIQEGASGKIRGGVASQSEIAGFLTLTRKLLSDRLTLQGGLRAANHTLYTPPLIPSFNLLYAPGENWQFRASYARGYRAPSLKERYLEFVDQNHHITGNTNLTAEYSHAVQASISRQFRAAGQNYFQLMATAWYNDVRNGISLVSQDPLNPANINYTYGNMERLQNTIGTLQGEAHYNNLHITAGYSLRHTFERTGSYPAFNASEWNARGNYYLQAAKLSIDVFCKWTGAQPALITDAATGSLTYGPRTGSVALLDASLHRSFWNRRLSLTVGVRNLLDVQTVAGSGAAVAGTAHSSGDGSQSFLGRRIFTGIRYEIGGKRADNSQ